MKQTIDQLLMLNNILLTAQQQKDKNLQILIKQKINHLINVSINNSI